MDYSLMIAPFDFGGHNKIAARQFFDNYAFFELTPKQAKEYFKWYMEAIPHRITLLWNYIQQDCPEIKAFDYSPESLISIWEWYETKIKQVPKSKEEIEYEVSIYPKWMEEEIQKITMKFTDETLSLALDIATYLGEVVVKNHQYLYWGHYSRPKNEVAVNRPVILGLQSKKRRFDPSRVVFVIMILSSKDHDKNQLYDLYRYWEDEYFIPSKPQE